MDNEENDFDFYNIDADQIVEEWHHYAKIYKGYAFKLADAKKEYEKAKSRLEVTAAELSLEIRSNPEKFGLLKTTEGVIEAAVLVHKEHQKAVSEMIELRHKVDILQATINTLDGKKKSLENMTELHLAGFRAEPKIKDRERKSVDRTDEVFKRGGKKTKV